MNESPDVPGKSAAGQRFFGWLRRARTIRDVPAYVEGVVFGTACVGLVLFIWWFLTCGEGDERIIPAFKLPSPAETFGSFRTLWFERELSLSAVTSIGRVLGGFLLAASVGVPLGIIAGSYLRVNAFLKPLALFGRNVPVAALVPLSMLAFRLGETQKVMFIFFATVPFIFFDSTTSAQNVPDRFIDTAYTLGAGRSRKKGIRLAVLAASIYAVIFAIGWYWMDNEDETQTLVREMTTAGFWERFAGGALIGMAIWFPITGHQVLRKVVLPMALPDIVNSLRLMFGLAFGYIMLAEMINAKQGLGALINVSQRRGAYEQIYLCLIIIALLAWGIDRAIMTLQRHLFPHLRNVQT